ncbi:hypothetical protein [uncultured Propionibacterium sp.]|uniref:hypothetical protein n=1 Tax=uncultured Propionibacterium sp. TaxID=218066 RepID=UPI00292D42C1|nr:hypothetical protein [uncultured Propionibacterium sp.]
MNDLSLGDVARLARVERPVVTMWLKRPVGGLHFPEQNAEGRVDADEVVDWLERTGRGNNPDARAELALYTTITPGTPIGELEAVLTLLATRAVVDENLAGLDRDELLDRVEELDPDDEWLLSETELAWTPGRAAQSDAIADAAWNDAAAYERLDEQHLARAAAVQLAEPLVHLLTAVTRAMLDDTGLLVDVRGACPDIVVGLTADEHHEMPELLLATDDPGALRPVRRRLAVHGLSPRVARFDDDWAPPPGSVVLVRLPDASQGSLDLLDGATLQLGEGVSLLALGPSALLVDPLAGKAGTVRDELLRSGVVRAIVQLPTGVIRGGSRERMALWLVQGTARRGGRGAVRVGDLSGRRLDGPARQELLGDLLAAVDSGSHVFSMLRSVAQAQLVAEGGPLVTPERVTVPVIGATPRQDAARIQQLYDSLARVLPPFGQGFEAVATDDDALRTERIALGAALERRGDEALLRLVKGRRLPELTSGELKRWRAADVAAGTPSRVDRLAVTRAVPDHELTRPGDVVFTVRPRPAAVVDRSGGAIVAFPARVLRVVDENRLSASSLAAAINARGREDRAWRGWLVPVRAVGAGDPEGFLTHLEGWRDRIGQWGAQVDELRALVTDSVSSGAVAIGRARDDDRNNEEGR